jgi:tetratricopeptide (TPR) repeat protein
VLSLFLLLGVLWAESAAPAAGTDPAGPAAEGEPVVVQLTPEQIWAELEPEDVLAEAVARRRVGDHVGASERLDHLKRRGALLAQVVYHWGILAEVQEDYELAVERYLEVEQTHPGSGTVADATFRRAYCLEDLGRHAESLQLVERLKQGGTWSASDALTLTLQQGIVELRSGKRRRGIKRIVATLGSMDPTQDQAWIRSKARLALMRAQLQEAAGINLASRWFTVRKLKARARLMAHAQQQAQAAFRLGEPEFALEGLMLLGDAHVQLYEDMLTTPVPWRVKRADHALYREAVADRSAVLLVKAHARYDEGVRVAARTQWQGTLTEELRLKREATRPQSD